MQKTAIIGIRKITTVEPSDTAELNKRIKLMVSLVIVLEF